MSTSKTLALAVAVGSATLLSDAMEPRITVYAGGVAGIADLVNPENSKSYCAARGGRCLHYSGWTA